MILFICWNGTQHREFLNCQLEPENEVDIFAVAVIKGSVEVEHLWKGKMVWFTKTKCLVNFCLMQMQNNWQVKRYFTNIINIYFFYFLSFFDHKRKKRFELTRNKSFKLTGFKLSGIKYNT